VWEIFVSRRSPLPEPASIDPVAERFELGRGGMGRVVRALDREVATRSRDTLAVATIDSAVIVIEEPLFQWIDANAVIDSTKAIRRGEARR